MRLVARSVLGAALLLAAAPAAMAQYATPPATNQVIQSNASTPVVISNNASNASVAGGYIQPPVIATADAAPENVPVVNQPRKKHRGGLWCDNTDLYGGHGANTHWGKRAFWDYLEKSE